MLISLRLEGFYLDDYLYDICGIFGFLEKITYTFISVVSVGSNQIFFTIDLSGRRDKKDIFSISLYHFSSVESSEVFVVDCRYGITWSDDINKFFGREDDIEEELSCFVIYLNHWTMRRKTDFDDYFIFESVFDFEFSSVRIDFSNGLVLFSVEGDIIVELVILSLYDRHFWL